MKPVTIIGMGLSPRDLTETHKAVIRRADILMGGERHLAFFPDSPAVKKVITKDIKGAIAYIRSQMASHRIVVLASGDPLFYGIGALIVRGLAPKQVEVLPNISSVAAAFAKIGEPWSHAAVVSLHGRDQTSALLKTLKTHDRVAVFTDPKNNPAWLAGFLLSKGMTDLSIGVFEKLGAPEEKTGFYGLAEAAGLVFGDPNMVILKREPRGDASIPLLHLGMAEEAFEHERGLMTKTEIRAVTLAKLRLRPHHTLWDLGAGSGSVAIEAAVLLGDGKIFAVEQKPERVAQIRANIRRFAVTNIEVIQAVLPKGIEALPAPDRVFVGGGGRHLDQIITAAAASMKPGGVIVVNTVLLANLQVAVNTLKGLDFETESIQVIVNRSKAMPWSERFEAGNPVWIISGGKKES